MVCSVLPSPISSARMALRPLSYMRTSHWRPSTWASRGARRPAGGEQTGAACSWWWHHILPEHRAVAGLTVSRRASQACAAAAPPTWYSRMHARMAAGCFVSGSASWRLGAAAALARMVAATCRHAFPIRGGSQRWWRSAAPCQQPASHETQRRGWASGCMTALPRTSGVMNGCSASMCSASATKHAACTPGGEVVPKAR